MANRIGGTATWIDNAASFAGRLTRWVDEHGVLLDGLNELREIGDEEAAVAALLNVRLVRMLRLSWELWEALLEGEGADPSDLLAAHLPDDLVAWCRSALWGLPYCEVVSIGVSGGDCP